ncbi:MAG: low molecular weight protein-tyrosine-phosphatase [Tahibacter sp.]
MRILFVCLGNICRSPILEAVLRERAARAGLVCTVASVGTGNWHVGAPADARAVAACARRGYQLEAHRARQLAPGDYTDHDWLLAADAANLVELGRRRPAGASARLSLALAYADILHPRDVADPYYGDDADFDRVVVLAERVADAVVRRHRHDAALSERMA